MQIHVCINFLKSISIIVSNLMMSHKIDVYKICKLYNCSLF